MTTMSQPPQERAARPNTLLDGIGTATRPTGPVLAIVMALVLFALGGGVGAVLTGVPKAGEEGGFAAVLGTTLGSFLPGLLLLFAWVKWKEGRGIRTLGFQSPRPFRSILLGAVVALVMFSVPVLLNIGSGQMTVVAAGGELVQWSQLGAVLVLLGGFLVQGGTEEVFNRGYLLQTVNRKWGITAAVIVQVVFFDVLHLANAGAGHVLPIVNLTLISVFLAFWALTEGGLWAVCAFHGVWNWTQGNVYGIRVSGNTIENSLLDTEEKAGANALLTGGTFGIEGSILVTAILLLGSVVAFVAWRRTARTAAATPS
jgi:uncharacterized protein